MKDARPLPLTPSNFPELNLPERWRQQLKELTVSGLTERQATDRIASEHYVSRTTVYREIHPDYKARRMIWWQRYVASHPHQARPANPDHKMSRSWAREDIGNVVAHAFEQVGYAPQRLYDLAAIIHEQTGIRFRAKTLLTLDHDYEARHKYPLLEQVSGYDPPRYVMAIPWNRGHAP